MLTLDMLPAGCGDCLWIEYGDPTKPRRILIDGGVLSTYEILAERIGDLPETERVFELLVVTHIDVDHIDGVIKLLRDSRLKMCVKDVWFNGWQHMSEAGDDHLGPVSGEFLSALIKHTRIPWNQAFDGEAVVVKGGETLPRLLLDGDLQITLLSPTSDQLRTLRGVWKKVVTKAGLAPGCEAEARRRLRDARRYQPDDDILGTRRLNIKALADEPSDPDSSEANGSSIAFLLEYDGRRLLLAGDAHADVIEASLRQYVMEEQVEHVALDAFKVPHHGSKANVTKDLIELLRCPHYLISTNGSYYGHPDQQAIARIIHHSQSQLTLWFNYRSDENDCWEAGDPRRRYSFKTEYPPTGHGGNRIEIV